MKYVGSRVRRTEDPRLVRGEGTYVSDLRLPHMLHAAFVRSPHAHARIVSIDLSQSRALAGVVAAYTPGDLPELARQTPSASFPPGTDARGIFPLASGAVRYVGEPVAVILAENSAVAADAVDTAVLEYDLLEPVVDVETAVTGSPLVWKDVPHNVAADLTVGFGDIDAAFDAADVVVDGRFSMERAAGAAMEPRAVAAAPGTESGLRLTVWDSTQAPHNVRDALARYLELQPDEVRVVTPDVGGGFGPKGRVYPEEYVVSALALRHGRPVGWVASRHEDLLTTAHGRGQIHHAQLAARADGSILGLRDHFYQDAGAYTPSGLGAAGNTVRHLLGPYLVSAAEIRLTGVYTNQVPTSPLRGGGRPEGIYVMERLLDRLAAKLDLDRAEIRRRNLLPPDAFPHDTRLPDWRGSTVTYDSGDFLSCLRAALEAIGHQTFPDEKAEARKQGRYLGLGLACFIESTGLGPERAHAEVAGDGTVRVAVGSPSNGQGHATTFAQLVADRLGVPIDAIAFQSGDTGLIASGTGTFASRMGQSGGNAVSLAARRLRERVLQVAADMLEIAPTDLELAGGEVRVRGLPQRRLGLAEIAREAARRGERLAGDEVFQPDRATTWAGGANAAVVEVDVETGAVRVLRYVVVHDSGTIVNPTVVEGQIHGGVAHGIGNALYEAWESGAGGQPLTASLADYGLPCAGDVPNVEIIHVQTPSPFNPEGIKGAGEGGTIAAIPTIVSGVEDALAPFGIALGDVPIRSHNLAMAIAAQRGGARGAEWSA